MPDDEPELIRDDLIRRGLVDPDDFICVAQDIPPYTPIPHAD